MDGLIDDIFLRLVGFHLLLVSLLVLGGHILIGLLLLGSELLPGFAEYLEQIRIGRLLVRFLHLGPVGVGIEHVRIGSSLGGVGVLPLLTGSLGLGGRLLDILPLLVVLLLLRSNFVLLFLLDGGTSSSSGRGGGSSGIGGNLCRRRCGIGFRSRGRSTSSGGGGVRLLLLDSGDIGPFDDLGHSNDLRLDCDARSVSLEHPHDLCRKLLVEHIGHRANVGRLEEALYHLLRVGKSGESLQNTTRHDGKGGAAILALDAELDGERGDSFVGSKLGLHLRCGSL